MCIMYMYMYMHQKNNTERLNEHTALRFTPLTYSHYYNMYMYIKS